MVCGVFSLLLRGKSGASWSAPLVHPLTQCFEQPLVQTVLGRLSVMDAFGRISSSTCLCRAVRTWNSGLRLRPRIFQSFGVWVLPVEYAVFSGRVRCLVPQWIHVLREAFGEFHMLMLRVAVSLSAVRTLNLDIISTSSPWWRCWIFRRILRHFSCSSGCPGVERQFVELSSAHNCECSRPPGGAGVAGSLTPR